MQDKIRIIFVDDEINILDGLQRMLRSMRQEWEMTFALGGQNALDALADKSYDVIVSDMRMPGISGVQLLNEIKRRFPQMVRIALSGQASKEAILRSVGPIHQYIAKPCEAEDLKKTIKHVCSYRDLLMNKKIQGLISQLESLPCLSSLYSSLMKELQSDDASIDKVAQIISQDVAMSAKVLQLVNSAFFGVRQHVSDIKQAVAFLGLEIIKALALTIKVFGQFDKIKLEGFSLSKLWDHSLAVGEWARNIAKAENAESEMVDHALISGMLHDIGKLVQAAKTPQEYQLVLSLMAKDNLTVFEAEKEIIGFTHAEIGAYLLGLWGFAHPAIEALTFHHQPANAPGKGFTVLTAVHVSNVLIHELFSTDNKSEKTAKIDADYLEELRLNERLAAWREACPKNLKVPC